MNLGRHKRAGQPKPGGTAKTPPRFGSGFSATKNRCMEKVTSVVMGDCQEILSAVREIKADSVKSRRKPIRLHPANPSVAKALKKAGSRNRLFGVGNYHPQDCGSNPKTRSS
jgi:hypothetical protein